MPAAIASSGQRAASRGANPRKPAAESTNWISQKPRHTLTGMTFTSARNPRLSERVVGVLTDRRTDVRPVAHHVEHWSTKHKVARADQAADAEIGVDPERHADALVRPAVPRREGDA